MKSSPLTCITGWYENSRNRWNTQFFGNKSYVNYIQCLFLNYKHKSSYINYFFMVRDKAFQEMHVCNVHVQSHAHTHTHSHLCPLKNVWTIREFYQVSSYHPVISKSKLITLELVVTHIQRGKVTCSKHTAQTGWD